MKKLIIYGANFVDTVRLLHKINAREPIWDIVGFVDDNPEYVNARVCDYPVLGNYKYLKEYVLQCSDVFVFNNVNSSISVHKIIGERLDALNVQVPSLVHPEVDTENVRIGKGVFIPHGCVLGCNTVIGNYVTFRYGVIISHDVRIDNYAFIGPGTVCTSHSVIEQEAYLGTRVTVINKAVIGKGSVVGASTLVNRNVRSGSTVVGIPARELNK